VPSRELSEAEFEAIKARVLSMAPKGLDEKGFEQWAGSMGRNLLVSEIAEAEQKPPAPEGSALQRFVGNAADSLNPIKIAKGLYNTVAHPIDTATAMISAQGAQLSKAKADIDQGRYVEAAGHGLAGVLPIVGPAAAAAGEQIGGGDVAGGLGRAVGLIGPVVAAAPVLRAGGRLVGKAAKPLVRSAVKPALSELRTQAGASMTGLEAQANRLVNFIVENGITSRKAAQAIVDEAESQIGAAVKTATKATDAPQRAARYLSALERSASRQGLPSDAVASIRSAANELLESSPLSENITTMVSKPSPTGLVTASGQPVLVPTPVTTRALRTDVMPDEALELARGGGKWGNKRAWGEQKGAAREAAKAVERAERDAVKAAVPETKPILARQGQAIQARKALDRQAFREGNREPISPFDVTTAAVETAATGRLPVLAIARHVLRENKLKMGVWAKKLERAIEANDEAAAAVILDKFGVERGAATSPSESRRPLVPTTATP
jgi:hypothetical protein